MCCAMRFDKNSFLRETKKFAFGKRTMTFRKDLDSLFVTLDFLPLTLQDPQLSTLDFLPSTFDLRHSTKTQTWPS